MFTEMRVRNFKSWRDTGPIRLAPVTAFFGTNSSGKTSLLQSLLLMKQTVQSTDRGQVLNFGDRPSLVSLGHFGDVIHGRDPRMRLGLEFSWVVKERIEVSDPDHRNEVLLRADEISFATEVGSRNGDLQVERFSYRPRDAGEQVARIDYRRRSRQQRRRPEYELAAEVGGNTNFLRRFQGRAWGLPPPANCYGFPDEAYTYFRNSAFINPFEIELERKFRRSLFYLGPLRRYPQRSYSWQGAVPTDVGVEGERSIEVLLASRERPAREGIARRLRSDGRAIRRVPVEAVVRDWLRELNLVHEFIVEQIAPNSEFYQVRIRRSAESENVFLPDVGFGVSQALPVLVMLATVPMGSVVILEQPELHLHPSAQSELADVILETARVNRAQVIVESHSEHLLTRLQRRVAEEKFDAEKLALYFCRNEGGRSVLEDLRLNLLGEIGNWPPHFFGDPMGESVAMVQARAQRNTD